MSLESPLISIIIPAFQHAEELSDCLASVFAQTFTDFEVIVVNDGSTDNTEEVIAPFRNRLIYSRQENKGGNNARNHGFSLSKGKFVLFCDADIIMQPHFLKKMFSTLQQYPKASYAYSSFRYGWKKFALWSFNAERLRKINYIHTTSLIRREHFPGFDETIRKLQDWDIWLTMLEAGHVGVWIPEILFLAIPHRNGISTWVPGIFYKIPCNKLGLRIPAIERFKAAEKIIKQKHSLV